MTAAESRLGIARRPQPTWIHGPATDIGLTLSWIPFAVAAAAVSGDVSRLRWFAAAVLLLSLAHQPMTLAMVYGDREQFAMRRQVFTWTPFLLLAAILVGLQVGFGFVAVIGALWNTEHTLMQRYGITRIYRRKGAELGSGRLDLMMLASWLALTLAWAVADPRTPERIESLALGSANRRGLELLVDLRPLATALLLVAFGAAVVATVRWLIEEHAHGFGANPATYMYLAGTAGLFLVAAAHPIAGLLAWVGSHAVEYFIVVITNLRSRYVACVGTDPSPAILGRAVQGPLGAIGVVLVVSVLVALGVRTMKGNVDAAVYAVAFFGLGGLHIFYDGFIWKLRKAKVAASFDIES